MNEIPDNIVPMEINDRLLRAAKAHEKFQTAPQTAARTSNADDLEKVGYPLRSILALPKMRGIGLQWAESLVPKAMSDGIIVLTGPTGRGKTVIATYLGWKRTVAGQSAGKFMTAFEMFGRMKQCWSRKEDSEALLTGWKRAAFLVIDEAQTRPAEAWDNNVLDELINARYAKMLPTVLIANLTLEEAQKALGPRIMDRANECGGIVNCDWKSYRA